MILISEWFSDEDCVAALEQLSIKYPESNIDRIRIELLSEGLCVQTMHIGSYVDEATILSILHNEWISKNGYVQTLKQHEISLSDPRTIELQSLKLFFGSRLLTLDYL